VQPQAADEEALAGNPPVPGPARRPGRAPAHDPRAPALPRPRGDHRLRNLRAVAQGQARNCRPFHARHALWQGGVLGPRIILGGNMQLHGITRRHLLVAMAGVGLGAALPATAASTRVQTPAPRRKDSVGVALIGLGYYAGHLLAPALQLARNCHLAGIVTGSPEKIPVWQQKYGIADRNVYSYDDLDRIADNPDIQAVYIVTPNHLHLPLTRRAAAAGKHVWCEKPMAMNAAEGEAMIEACRGNKVQLTIGYRMQHEANTRRLMAMARELPYGRILKVRADAGFHAYDDVDPANKPWRLVAKYGGGAMYDMGVYSLNAARYVTGQEPVAVSARHEIQRPHLFDGVDETTYFTLEFADGLVAECSTSFGRNMNLLHVD